MRLPNILRPAVALLAAACSLASLLPAARAQPTASGPLALPPNGPRRAEPDAVRLTGATIHPRPGEVLRDATLLLRGGRIVAVHGPGNSGNDARLHAREIDASGLHIYPGFIEPYVEVDAPAPDSAHPHRHWSPRVTPNRNAADGPGLADEAARKHRALGFTAAHIAPRGGIFAGASAVVSLAEPPEDESSARPPLLRDAVFQIVDFENGGWGGGWGGSGGAARYPTSDIGAVALIRQTLLDAEWAAANGSVAERALLRRLAPERADAPGLPLLFTAESPLHALLATKIAREFGRPVVIYGNGQEFRYLRALAEDAQAGLLRALILPLKYPGRPDVSTRAKAEATSLDDMLAWEFAPRNPAALLGAFERAAIDPARLADGTPPPIIALSTAEVGEEANGEKQGFLSNLRRAVRAGLSPDDALAMLTTGPAELLGLSDELGTIEAGKRANLVVASGPIFDEGTEIRDVWIDGRRHEINKPEHTAFRGTWEEEPAPDAAPARPPARYEIEQKKGKATVTRVLPNGAAVRPGDAERPNEAPENDDAGQKPDAERKPHPLEGAWNLTLAGRFELRMMIDGERIVISEPGVAETSTATDVALDGGSFSLAFDHAPFGMPGVFRLSGELQRDGTLIGSGARPDGREFNWTGIRERPNDHPDAGPEPGEDPDPNGQRPSDGPRTPDADPPSSDDRDKAENIEATDRTLSFTLPSAQGPELYSTVLVTRPGEPDRLLGSVLRPDGTTRPFRARRVSPLAGTPDFDGTWRLYVGPSDDPFFEMSMTVEGTDIMAKEGDNVAPAREVQIEGDTISFIVDDTDDGTGSYPLRATMQPDGTLKGIGEDSAGGTFAWTGERIDGEGEEAEIPDHPGYPFGPYARAELPEQRTVLFTNATIWTSADAGVVENGAMLISGGKVLAVGTGPQVQDVLARVRLAEPYETVDLGGRHVTPGIIDAHSHTGLFSLGVNESGQAVTAEVRVGDSLDPSYINWYRQLAGGLTVVNSLHGSANPIGGQSRTHKIRWGSHRPEGFVFEGAKPGIKFALGENVKRRAGRYPDTRMGVEALIRDRFQAAKEYAEQPLLWQIMDDNRRAPRPFRSVNADPDSDPTRRSAAEVRRMNPQAYRLPDVPPRRDLGLEALAEVLAGERLVHCHAYRQDEILMLTRIARDFGFRIGTFQHGLEVYKVAEAVREHAVGASIFSDWWMYKFEVYDAIAYAGPIQHDAGVLTSFNSDSDELARRLNREAAKAVKYSNGRIMPEEALRFVTINPAIQLGIDDRVGSLEPGKDADFAVWSGDPLSTLTRCEQTWIDGRRYFSLDDDRAMRDRIAAERQRLIEKILDIDRKPAAPEEAPTPEDEDPRIEGDATEGVPLLVRAQLRALREHNLALLERGLDPDLPASARGDCGCGLAHDFAWLRN